MRTKQNTKQMFRGQAGLTMVELMVALAIGSFLVIGSVQIYSQSRQAFVINESIARVQETAQFAMDTIEADLRMASNWGQTSRALDIEGRSIGGIVDPNGLTTATFNQCGSDWVFDLALPVEGDNNSYTLACAPGPSGTAVAQPSSDLITVRRATVAAQAPDAGVLQIQSSRTQGILINDGIVPANMVGGGATTHNLIVNSYYVATDSDLIPGVPTLRRKSLVVQGGVSTIVDLEVAPGVENLQVQLGVDVNGDNAVDRYVNPGDPIVDPGAGGFVPGARVITARVWLVVRGISIEVGVNDNTDYEPGDVDLGTYNDEIRRMQVSKTILLRNSRT